jgi:tetratricopeptide (TPR) repeat protein
VKIVRKLLSQSRVRQARRRLADDPSPVNYAALAREFAWEGNTREALRVCNEGLQAYPGNPELARLSERTRRANRESRLLELKQELRESPRPAVYREMCEVLIESDQLIRAEECALEWLAGSEDPEAKFVHARVCVQRFLEDRAREAGRRAFEVLDEVLEALPRDARPWELRLELASKIGAWGEARTCAAKLLELQPGDPELEGRFRTLSSHSDGAPDIGQALREVERTGQLVQEEQSSPRRESSNHDVRPQLKEMAEEEGVNAVVYLRGSTALVQGPRGATAERAARAIRRIVRTGRSTARKLGLGQVSAVQLEGSFGSVSVITGETDAGALWCSGKLSRAREKMLMNLAGCESDSWEDEA